MAALPLIGTDASFKYFRRSATTSLPFADDMVSSPVHVEGMISASLFAILHLVIVVALLVGLALTARPSRMGTSRHRGVRYRRLTTNEVLKRLANDGRWDEK